MDGRPEVESGIAPDETERSTVGELGPGPITIMFTDIEGSAHLTERLGDRVAVALLGTHDDIVRRELRIYGGVEVKHLGDGFMVAFASPWDGVKCAVAIQRAMAAYNESHTEPLRVRCGLNIGEPIRVGDDLFGISVILASRIVDQAQGAEILVSSPLKEQADTSADLEFGAGREQELKGLAGSHRLFEVIWQMQPALLASGAPSSAKNGRGLPSHG